MDVFFCINSVVTILSILVTPISGQVIADDENVDAGEEDICYGFHANKLYCTCKPSDVDVRGVDCYVLSDFPSSDPLWRSFAPMTKLERLTLYSQGEATLRYVPREALAPSANVLQTLEIKHASLVTLEPYVFLNATALSTIDLANNDIETVEPNSFADLPALKELTLSENKLAAIRRGTFVRLVKLSVLLLDRNRISQIEDGAFKDLVSLQELTLMKNELTRVAAPMFRGLSALKRLELGINRIQHLGPGVFSQLTQVQEINLRENELKSIDTDAFINLNNLRVLYLNRNRLVGISDRTFGHLTSLSYLDLRHNHLTTLSEKTFKSLELRQSNTSQVYLSGNKFACDCRIGWMLEMAKLKSYDELNQWKQIDCQLPAEDKPTIQMTSTERLDQKSSHFKKIVTDSAGTDNEDINVNDRPASLSDSPENNRKFVSLEDAAQYLKSSSVCSVTLSKSVSSSPAKADLSSNRPLTIEGTSGSVKHVIYMPFIIIIFAIIVLKY